jgi:hypothetical protein
MDENGFTIFGPYRRPIMAAEGGGQLVLRQLAPQAEGNVVFPQQWTPVSITQDGAELQGQLTVMGLVNVQTGAGNSGTGAQI